MKVTFLIGNGFNYMVEDIIRHYQYPTPTAKNMAHKREVADGIKNITALWKKFDAVFKDFRDHFKEKDINISDEDLIRMIYTVLNLFSSMPGLSQILDPADVNKLRDIFGKFLLDQIRDIAREFREHQRNDQYGKIRKFFPNFSRNIQEIIRTEKVENVHFCSTNYDGVLDTLLTKQPRGFITDDAFRNTSPPTDLLTLYPKYLYSKQLVLTHLHGSYRFTRNYEKHISYPIIYKTMNP